MSVKRKIGFGVLFIMLLLLFAFVSVYFLAPPVLNSETFLQKIRGAGFNGFSWQVRRIGLDGADIGPLQLGPEKSLSIRSVRMDYSPGGLYDRRIRRIRISGVEIFCGIKDEKIFIRGIDPRAISAGFKSEKTAAPASERPIFPVSVGNIEISDGTLVFDREGDLQRLPFTLDLSIQKNGRIKGGLKAFPMGQEVFAEFDLDFQNKKIRPKINLSGSSSTS